MPFPPSVKPAPDAERFLRVLRRDGEPDRVPFYELFADPPIMEACLEHPMGEGTAHRDSTIEYQYKMGYDYVPATLDGFVFPQKPRKTVEDSASDSGRLRGYQTEDVITLATREDVADYQWPDPDSCGTSIIEYTAEHLKEGMTVVGHVPGGVLENVMWLCGYTGLAYMLVDDPDLAREVFDTVGEILVRIARRYAAMDCIGAIVMGDDMGHKTGPMFSPAMLREYVFPWHKRLVETAHAHNKPFILHACGNLTEVMDDIIDSSGFDAKHSFEDIFMPVTEAKVRWGNRIALLGGVDVDFLCRASETDIRAYVRRTLEICMPGGGYAMGTGNSVANYIPVRNFLVMLDEAWKVGRYV